MKKVFEIYVDSIGKLIAITGFLGALLVWILIHAYKIIFN